MKDPTIAELKTTCWDSIKRMQDKKFSLTAKHLLPITPFYSKLFATYGVDAHKLKTVDDWKTEGLPLIKKATYMKQWKDFVPKPSPKEAREIYSDLVIGKTEFYAKALFDNKIAREVKEYFYPKMIAFSAGTTTGQPTPFMITGTQKQKMNELMKEITGYLIKLYLNNVDTKGMNLFPYAPHIAWHAVHAALENADLNLCTAAGGAIKTERLVQIASDAQPNILCGMVGYLKHRFLPMAISAKIQLPKRTMFVNGATKIYEPERQKIRELAAKIGVAEAIVLDMYGASEMKHDLLPECNEHSGYHHVMPLANIIRTVQTKGTTNEYIDEYNFSNGGFGAIWNIDGGGTILEGYLIGDYFDEITTEPCSCGLKTETIRGITRVENLGLQLKLTGMVEEKIKGTRVNISELRAKVLAVKDVDECQILVKKGKITIKVVGKGTKSKISELLKKEEYTAEIKETKIDEILGEKMKFEGIKIE